LVGVKGIAPYAKLVGLNVFSTNDSQDFFDALYNEDRKVDISSNSWNDSGLVGRPGRIQSLRKFLDYILKFDDVWICKRIDIAKHWIKNY